MSEPETNQPAVTCLVQIHGKPCGRDAYDDEGRCICHSHDPNKDGTAFNCEIEAMLARKDYDFTEFVFAHDAEFKDRVFEEPVCFVGAVFLGRAGFFHAMFRAAADFSLTIFFGQACFWFATFEDKAIFMGARFKGLAAFTRATFEEGAQFAFTGFADALGFCGATFLRDASFLYAAFEGPAFLSATFAGDALFFHATFEDKASFIGSEDKGVFSREAGTCFMGIGVHQPEGIVFQHAFLGRARFAGADLRHLSFTGVEWARRPLWGPRWHPLVKRQDWIGRGIRWLCSMWPARLKPRGRFAVWDELAPEQGDEKEYALIGKLYRQLKHNYEEQRDPITAGDFHFGEMHMRRLSNPPKSRVLRFLRRNMSLLALYRWISGYGEDYVLAGAWILVAILAFALAFAYIPALALQSSPASAASLPMQGSWSRFWYSVMCFLLRGDRPLQPVHPAGHYLSVAEGVIGPALIAMFVLALNRRFKR
jgi:uncharacterized protein YjbI with pentapeptide repeats